MSDHMLIQQYPGDKWRWVVGGDAGGWHCELYRIPASGEVDSGSYRRTEYLRSQKSARYFCGLLNESLRMGGILGSSPE